jgi:hypothetical protein
MPQLVILLVLNLLTPPTQELSFDIIYRGSKIGHLEATYRKWGSQEAYTSHTSLTTTLFREINLVLDNEVLFKEGRLQDSRAKVLVNGTQHQHTTVEWENNRYKIVKNHEDVSFHPTPVYLSTIKMLFEEPNTFQQVFSEFEGINHGLKLHPNNTYEKTKPSGASHYYRYQNGRLTEAQLKASFVNYSIISR